MPIGHGGGAVRYGTNDPFADKDRRTRVKDSPLARAPHPTGGLQRRHPTGLISCEPNERTASCVSPLCWPGGSMAISPDDQRGLGSFEPPPPAATPFPTADVQAKPQLGEVEYESLPVRRPEEDLKEVKIVVRASVLTRCRSKLRGAAEASFPWYELALAASTLAAGAVAGAIPADIKPGTNEDFIFFTLLPPLAVGSFVAYLFLRHRQQTEISGVAADVLAELPDPEKAQ